MIPPPTADDRLIPLERLYAEMLEWPWLTWEEANAKITSLIRRCHAAEKIIAAGVKAGQEEEVKE